MQINCFVARKLVLLMLVLLGAAQALSQTSTAKKPWTTVYKCSADGKVTFSDTPCPGAEQTQGGPLAAKGQPGATQRAAQDAALAKALVLPTEATGAGPPAAARKN